MHEETTAVPGPGVLNCFSDTDIDEIFAAAFFKAQYVFATEALFKITARFLQRKLLYNIVVFYEGSYFA